MRYLLEALSWLADGENWLGPSGIATRVGQHLALTVLVVAVSAAIAWPAGVLIGHWRRGAALVGALTGAARAIPTLGLLTIFAMLLGIGLGAPIVALVILAVPSLLAGAYAGIQAIDPAIAAASKAIGMSASQVVFKVEIPLAAPVIVGGLRAATLQVVATATLAAYVADYGLGRFIMLGIRSRDYPQMLGGSIVVIVLAIVLEAGLAWLQRWAKKIADPAGSAGSGRAKNRDAGADRDKTSAPETAVSTATVQGPAGPSTATPASAEPQSKAPGTAGPSATASDLAGPDSAPNNAAPDPGAS